MTVPVFANNARSTLAASVSDSSTTLTVQSADASEFPAPGAGEHFTITLTDASNNLEIVKCTNRTGVVLTVERAQEGTVARAWAAGDRASLRLTAGALDEALAQKADAAVQDGFFTKADPDAVAFTKTGAGAASVKAGTLVEVDGSIIAFAVDTAITMPGLTAGTDYAIWVHPDATIEATTSHIAAPAAGARKIGGFHYAPGGNATGFNTGGDTTPAINEYSLWDLKWRPACPDPRGMALVADGFWCDIYLLGVNHHTDGTSAFNVTIADGASPPKVPAQFGGNGATAYGSLTWYEAAEVMASHGKQLLSQAEFAAAAYGVVEASAGGTDPGSTILRHTFTSKWGVMLATGNLWVWGKDFSTRPDGSGGWNWRANTGGRGSQYIHSDVGLVAARFGADWGSGAHAGSRASGWSVAPWHSASGIGARGRSDHLKHV